MDNTSKTLLEYVNAPYGPLTTFDFLSNWAGAGTLDKVKKYDCSPHS